MSSSFLCKLGPPDCKAVCCCLLTVERPPVGASQCTPLSVFQELAIASFPAPPGTELQECSLPAVAACLSSSPLEAMKCLCESVAALAVKGGGSQRETLQHSEAWDPPLRIWFSGWAAQPGHRSLTSPWVILIHSQGWGCEAQGWDRVYGES